MEFHFGVGDFQSLQRAMSSASETADVRTRLHEALAAWRAFAPRKRSLSIELDHTEARQILGSLPESVDHILHRTAELLLEDPDGLEISYYLMLVPLIQFVEPEHPMLATLEAIIAAQAIELADAELNARKAGRAN